jgi:hypothetical protein
LLLGAQGFLGSFLNVSPILAVKVAISVPLPFSPQTAPAL